MKYLAQGHTGRDNEGMANANPRFPTQSYQSEEVSTRTAGRSFRINTTVSLAISSFHICQDTSPVNSLSDQHETTCITYRKGKYREHHFRPVDSDVIIICLLQANKSMAYDNLNNFVYPLVNTNVFST